MEIELFSQTYVVYGLPLVLIGILFEIIAIFGIMILSMPQRRRGESSAASN